MVARFENPPIISGWGALSALAQAGGRRAALITDDGVMERLGVVDCARQYLAQGGAQSEIAGRISRETQVADVEPLVEALAAQEPDVIVALGGGSVLDAAKAAWAFYEWPSLDWETAFTPGSLPQVVGRARLVAVPTTSGTGSEVSQVAVLIDPATGLKRLIMSPGILPSLAIVDPALAATMPPALTAHSAFDALTHAIEAMVASVVTEFSMGNALRAIRLIVTHLPAALRDERPARENMHLAATLAGLAVNNSMAGLAHGLDQMGPLFGVPHGLVCAILLPHTLAFNLDRALEAYAEMGAAVGVPGAGPLEQARAFVRRLTRLATEAGLPLSFEAAGVDRRGYYEAMDKMVTAGLASRATQLSPRVPDAAEAEALLDRAYRGELPQWVVG